MILKKELRMVLIKQQEDLQRDLGVERDISLKILPKFATIISGVRRCGKSTLARQYLRRTSPVYYIRFEDISLTGFELNDFNKAEEVFSEMFGEGGTYFFDEIQNIKGWENYVRQLIDRGEKVIITGSNAAMLSSELGTKLTGRHLSGELYPFSYNEFLKLRNSDHSLQLFDDYIGMGGFPEYLKTDDPSVLRNLFQDIFYRDIMQRNELRSETAIKMLLYYVISNIGKETSYNKLKNLTCAGSVNSVSQFVHHFEMAYMLFELRKFDYSVKKQMVNPKKLYCVDNGLISQNAFSFSENKGRMLENLVFLQLKREGKDLFYHRGIYECDFVIRIGTKIREAIQVCYELSSDNRQREINGLIEAMETYGLKEGLLLTYDEEDIIKVDNRTLSILPVWKLILGQGS